MPQSIYPAAIKPGDTLAIVAPASAPQPAQLAAGIASLEQAGYRIKTYRNLCAAEGYLAGSDIDRADELMRAFVDPEVAGVVAARGGYGVSRLLDKLDYSVIEQNPKVLAGYSDLSALHAAINGQTGLVTFHSPNVIDGLAVGDPAGDLATQVSFWQAVGHNNEATYMLPNFGTPKTITPGNATGRLVGGNLAVFAGLIGTPYMPSCEGAILFLEDTGEAPYRIDRLLSQLYLAELLDSVAGVLLGHFTDCVDSAEASFQPTITTDQVLLHYLSELGVPVLAGFAAGHDQPNLTLPMGATVTLDASRQQLTVHQATT